MSNFFWITFGWLFNLAGILAAKNLLGENAAWAMVALGLASLRHYSISRKELDSLRECDNIRAK